MSSSFITSRPDTLAHSEDPDEMLLNAFVTHPEPRLSKGLLHTARVKIF